MRTCKDCGIAVGPYLHRCADCQAATVLAKKRAAREAEQAARRCPSCGGPIAKFAKLCETCSRDRKRERNRRYVEANRPSLREKQNAWARANYDPVKAREKSRRYRSNPEARKRMSRSARRSFVEKQYGITMEQYEEMTSGACAICGAAPEDKLCLDHCHATGMARGGLCSRCNSGLGYFRDDPVLLRRAAAYLLGSTSTWLKPLVEVYGDLTPPAARR